MDVYKVKNEITAVQFTPAEFLFVRNALRVQWHVNGALGHLSKEEREAARQRSRLAGAIGTLMNNWHQRRQTAELPLLLAGEQAAAVYDAIVAHTAHAPKVPSTIQRPATSEYRPVEFKHVLMAARPYAELSDYRLQMR